MKEKVSVLFLTFILLILSSANSALPGKNIDEKQINKNKFWEEAQPSYGESRNGGSGNVVTFRDDQIMLINGVPFFPIGLFSERLEPWNGYNNYWGLPCDLYDYSYSGDVMHIFGQNLFEDFDEGIYQEALQCIDHPNFLGWYSKDEPVWQSRPGGPWQGGTYEELREIYCRLKGCDEYEGDDPDHPVWMNFAAADVSDDLDIWIQKRQQYAQAADIVSVDVYNKGFGGCPQCNPGSILCVLDNPYISVVGDFVDILVDNVTSGEKPVWIIPQAWGAVNEKEIRFQSWQAIIHGATGIFYWSSRGGDYGLVMPDAENVAQELVDLHELLVAPTVDATVTSTDDIETMVKDISGLEMCGPTVWDYCILAVNRNPDPSGVTAEFDLSSLGITYGGYGELINEEETVHVVNGRFSLYFEPFDTHLIIFKYYV